MAVSECLFVTLTALLVAAASSAGTPRLLQNSAARANLVARLDDGQYRPETYELTASTAAPPRPTTLRSQMALRSLCLSPRGMFPHPDDCHKYLDCWDGRVLEKSCPDDLVFSDLALGDRAKGGFCDFLEYVDCGSRPLRAKDAGEVPQQQENVFNPATSDPVTPAPGVEVRWVDAADGTVPRDATVAGYGRSPAGVVYDIFVGRVISSHSAQPHLLPCRLEAGRGCFVAWNNLEYLETQYQVMMAANAGWVPTTNTTAIPEKAIIVGYLDSAPREDMFLGRAELDGAVITGYLTGSRPNLVQTLNGRTYFAGKYEILVKF